MNRLFRFASRVRHFGFAGLLAAVFLLATSACRFYDDLQLWNAPVPLEGVSRVEQTASYYCGNGELDPDWRRHRMDIFRPIDRSDCPVVILVHGGAWVTGDNRCCGLYSSVGKFLASQGICAVLPNYRLSPNVTHPEHIKDLAQAFAWTKKHIAEFGGNADQIYLVGHSAGGHLVALLATDESWLEAVGCRLGDIRGVVAISGVFHIPPTAVTYSLGGSMPNSFHWNQLLPVRSPSSKACISPLPGLTLKLDVYGLVFGDDPIVRASASPLTHVRPGLPPFLILSAEHDLPTLPEMAHEFHCALCDHDCQSELYVVQQRNHNSIMFEALKMQDPVGAAIAQFVRIHSIGHAPWPSMGCGPVP